MAFQIANLDKPNSKTNTVVFSMFNAKDSWANLKTALLQYKHQVNILKETTWRLVNKQYQIEDFRNYSNVAIICPNSYI